MEGPSLLYRAIENVFARWTALQIAIDNGMGGLGGEAKAQELTGELEWRFLQKAGLEQDEVEDHLEDYLYEKYDVVLEDGSIAEVASMLCRFCRLFRDDQQELQRVLSTMPPPTKQVSQKVKQLEPRQNPAVPVSPPQSTSKDNELASVPEGMEVDPEDEGWQTITRNKRK